MAEVVTGFGSNLVAMYNSLLTSMPSWVGNFIELFLLVLLVFFYALLVWKLYRFIGTKNLFKLNLSKYNKSEHPVLTKLLATGLYLLEYIIIVPFLIFFWFAIFTLFLIVLNESLTINAILLVSATIIAVIRIASYYSEDLSREIAKLLPYTLLGVAILDYIKIFDLGRIINHLASLPQFFGTILDYFIFIFLLEIILRFFDFLFIALGFHSESSLNED